jgi:hypothetical protein
LIKFVNFVASNPRELLVSNFLPFPSNENLSFLFGFGPGFLRIFMGLSTFGFGLRPRFFGIFPAAVSLIGFGPDTSALSACIFRI